MSPSGCHCALNFPKQENEFYVSRSKAKDITELPVDDMGHLYLNENLTQRRKRFFWLTKQKVIELYRTELLFYLDQKRPILRTR